METIFDLADKQKSITELEKQVEDPEFWNDQKTAQKVLAELSGLKKLVESFDKLKSESDDLIVLAEMAVAENDQNTADEVADNLEKLSKEIELGNAGLKTLKPESPEYMSQAKEVLMKRASLQAQQEFFKRQLELQDQRWTEQLYKDILSMTKKVASTQGLDLVLERSEPDLPAGSINDLVMMMRSHKVIYSGGSLDISDQVIANLDGEE